MIKLIRLLLKIHFFKLKINLTRVLVNLNQLCLLANQYRTICFKGRKKVKNFCISNRQLILWPVDLICVTQVKKVFIYNLGLKFRVKKLNKLWKRLKEQVKRCKILINKEVFRLRKFKRKDRIWICWKMSLKSVEKDSWG